MLVTNVAGKPLLAGNGGPTQTIAVVSGSPAIGAGIGAICRGGPVNGIDQRGMPRSATGKCDSGAYQFQGH